jgi:hypothetical protein
MHLHFHNMNGFANTTCTYNHPFILLCSVDMLCLEQHAKLGMNCSLPTVESKADVASTYRFIV